MRVKFYTGLTLFAMFAYQGEAILIESSNFMDEEQAGFAQIYEQMLNEPQSNAQTQALKEQSKNAKKMAEQARKVKETIEKNEKVVNKIDKNDKAAEKKGKAVTGNKGKLAV